MALSKAEQERRRKARLANTFGPSMKAGQGDKVKSIKMNAVQKANEIANRSAVGRNVTIEPKPVNAPARTSPVRAQTPPVDKNPQKAPTTPPVYKGVTPTANAEQAVNAHSDTNPGYADIVNRGAALSVQADQAKKGAYIQPPRVSEKQGPTASNASRVKYEPAVAMNQAQRQGLVRDEMVKTAPKWGVPGGSVVTPPRRKSVSGQQQGQMYPIQRDMGGRIVDAVLNPVDTVLSGLDISTDYLARKGQETANADVPIGIRATGKAVSDAAEAVNKGAEYAQNFADTSGGAINQMMTNYVEEKPLLEGVGNNSQTKPGGVYRRDRNTGAVEQQQSDGSWLPVDNIGGSARLNQETRPDQEARPDQNTNTQTQPSTRVTPPTGWTTIAPWGDGTGVVEGQAKNSMDIAKGLRESRQQRAKGLGTGGGAVNNGGVVSKNPWFNPPQATRNQQVRYLDSPINFGRNNNIDTGRSGQFGRNPDGTIMNGSFSQRRQRQDQRAFDRSIRNVRGGLRQKALETRQRAISNANRDAVLARGQDLNYASNLANTQSLDRYRQGMVAADLLGSQQEAATARTEATREFFDRKTMFPVKDAKGNVTKYESNPVASERAMGMMGDIFNDPTLNAREVQAYADTAIRLSQALTDIEAQTGVPYSVLEQLLGPNAKPLSKLHKRKISNVFEEGNYGIIDLILGTDYFQANDATMTLDRDTFTGPLRNEELDMLVSRVYGDK